MHLSVFHQLSHVVQGNTGKNELYKKYSVHISTTRMYHVTRNDVVTIRKPRPAKQSEK